LCAVHWWTSATRLAQYATVILKPPALRRFRLALALTIGLTLGAAGARPQSYAACQAPAFAAAAVANTTSVRNLAWTPFGRAESGWEIYAPRVAQEIGARCGPTSERFAQALAAWQARHRLAGAGVFDPATFAAMKGAWQGQRPFVQLSARGVCPAPPLETSLASGRREEGYGGKVVQLRPGALEAWRRMVAAARAEGPAIRADARNLALFSGYRSPDFDAARCARDHNCDGRVRATCSPHRTGLALDLYVGQAPGFGPDSTADANRLAQSRNPAYLWLLANAGRFGFMNYPFEPWHWEWTGEAP
jgi:D-alanyl-D-alanine carboxypeptidase